MKVRFTSSRFFLTAIPAILLALAICSPGFAASREAGERGNYRGQCRKLTLQIDHFHGTILPLARQRGNRAWEAATAAQVNRLAHRRADLCPKYGAQRTMLTKARDQVRKFNQLIATAGRATAAYFTGGLTGGVGP